MKKWFITAIMGLASTSLLGVEAEKKAIPIQTVKIKPQVYQEYREYYGTVHGIEEAQLVSVMGGQVQALNIKPGDVIKKKVKLCDIDGVKAQNTLSSAWLNEK